MSPALTLQEPSSFTSSTGLWTPSKAPLATKLRNNDNNKSWSISSSPLSQSQSQSQPSPLPQQQEGSPLHLDDDHLTDDINTLWNTRWRHACRRRQHPFQDASYLDFAPVFAALTAQGVTSARAPAYARALAAAARALADEADARAAADDPVPAARLLLRACALLRVARHPASPEGEDEDEQDDLRREARDLQRAYHRRAVGLLPSARDSPAEDVLVPHVRHPAAAAAAVGGVRERGDAPHQQLRRRRPHHHIPLLVRVPAHTLRTGAPCPAAVVLTRDRTGATRACEAALARGWAAVVVEEEEEEEEDAAATAGVCASVLDWMAAVGFFDTARVVALGGGRAVARAAAAPACGPRLRGAVAYAGDRPGAVAGEGEAGVPRCHVLVVDGAGAGRTVESNGLWTPAGERAGEEEEEEEEEEPVALSAYAPGSWERVGSLEDGDGAWAHDWLADVMEGREPRVPAAAGGGEAGEKKKNPMPEWFSRESTPPDSDVEMASSCGSSP